MTDPLDSAIDDLLCRIELRELPSLQWGYVDGSLSRSEIETLAAATASTSAEVSAPELVEVLRRRRLIFPVGSTGSELRFRSRFAETVRLLARLRQITPNASWSAAPSLVSGCRVAAERRRVPRREIGADDVIANLRSLSGWDPSREAAISAILDGERSTLLSDFQVRAAREVLSWRGRTSRGAVITAGTGAGKTLAFYLPAIARIGTMLRKSDYWTKAVSVYPRTELLKDQFSEVVSIARATDATQVAAGRRPIRLGALFGSTPKAPSVRSVADKWRSAGRGFECPYLRCPMCGQNLAWLESDLVIGRERLTCLTRECETVVGDGGQVALTRESLEQMPADLLFTTAETLNMRLSDPDERPILGISPQRDRRAFLLLLDEIHTYSGTSGAQVANVVRRWRHAVDRPVHVTGLSATLQDAGRYFADLTGLLVPSVVEISPSQSDLDEISMAYQMIARADSSNRTAVLSTTIQAAMLLARMGDLPGSDAASAGMYGSRLFVFTDKLDITNRLYDDLRDAEGVDSWGRPFKPPLAGYRASGGTDDRARRLEGQLWDAAEEIREGIDTPLKVTRTSSQDVGVDAASDVIVATASLEVGFNDPFVGSIIQHRAPRDLAAFVQRRGRAARAITMRPWMLTVLSEYGRDRLQYQSYEQLIEPILPPRRLPTTNRYVLRMQAVYALLDWLSLIPELRPSKAWPWAFLNGPSDFPGFRKRRQAVRDVLQGILDGDPSLIGRLHDHVRGSLGISGGEADSLLWAPPRSLILEVIPTLWRRLATEWMTTAPGELDLHSTGPYPHPLPDFMPSNLFSDLNLPEVLIHLPPTVHSPAMEPTLAVSQALREFAPGHVTRRYGVERAGLSHWVAIDPSGPVFKLPAGDWIEHGDPLGKVELDDGRVVEAIRPWSIAPQIVPRNISASSRGDLRWQSAFLATAGDSLNVPHGARLVRHCQKLTVHLTARRSAMTVTRYSSDGEATVRQSRGTEATVRIDLVDDHGQPMAVGFRHEVDAIAVRLDSPPRSEFEAVARTDHARPWLSRFLRDAIEHDPFLLSRANRFQLGWLADAVLLALALKAMSGDDVTREEVFGAVDADLWGALNRAVTPLVTTPGQPADDETDDGPGTNSGVNASTPKLLAALRALIDDRDVLARLREHVGMIRNPGGEFTDWLGRLWVETIGDALLTACQIFVPDQTDSDALLVDVEWTEPEPTIWISETTLGGGGVIEAIAKAYVRDPWRFVRAVDAALAPLDGEIVAEGIHRAVALMAGDPSVASMADRLRGDLPHVERMTAQIAYNQILGSHGLPVDKSLAVALNQRVLRRGTDRSLDSLLMELAGYRETIDNVLGCTVDHRLFAIALAVASPFAARLTTLVSEMRGSPATTAEVAGTMSGVFWPRPADVRAAMSQAYNPYRRHGLVDTSLARALMEERAQSVQFTDVDWAVKLCEVLARDGIGYLEAQLPQLPELGRVIPRFIADPIALDFLRVYPTVAGIEMVANAWLVKFEVRELA